MKWYFCIVTVVVEMLFIYLLKLYLDFFAIAAIFGIPFTICAVLKLCKFYKNETQDNIITGVLLGIPATVLTLFLILIYFYLTTPFID